ncbi:MAG: phosphodiesterase [Clostridia bacterium]|nr:phosphodiesterase [Clostridia bacterium]
MKYFFASDLHGDAVATEKILALYRDTGAEKLILLGDILYHGPRNDLPAGYAPKRVIALLNPLRDEILAVRGNCDAEVDQMVLDFPITADYISLPLVDGKRAYLTHGHVYSPEKLPPEMRAGDVLICGHTHVAGVKSTATGQAYLNPGSVSIPKENTPPCYMVYSDEAAAFQIYSLTDGSVFAVYNL